MSAAKPARPPAPPVSRAGQAEFRPKILTVLSEGYGLPDLRADVMAGLTVAIVALPLSMAIAIASGVGPERGLYTTIIGGFLVSALGGSRFQIGGPAGAFIVLVAACVLQIGVEGLILATFLSGMMLIAIGALRLGSTIAYVPWPVTVGFTAGIGALILASQLREIFGLDLPGPEPAEIGARLAALWAARETLSPAALAVALGSMGVILGLRRLRPGWPGMLIAVVGAALATALFDLPVQTIATRFGDLPRLPPLPELPQVTVAGLGAALPFALSFTLLGAIESLLSALVADGMTGRRHRANAELVAQGVANMGSALFGGFCVTGTVARTATNVRAGSRGPVSGMLHALFVLFALLIAAPWAGHIPLAALAGVLAIVAWNMVEREEIRALLRQSRAEALVLVVTFLLVVFRDLTEGIVVGFALGGLVFIRRMSEAAEVSPAAPADLPGTGGDVVRYHLRGPFFFGAAARLGSVLDQIAAGPRLFVLDMSEVPFVDVSGARSLVILARKVARQGGQLHVTGVRPDLERALRAQGAVPPLVRFGPPDDSPLPPAPGLPPAG